MKKITMFDTSIGTLNLGDEIIVDAVNKEIRNLLPNNMMLRIPTHEVIGKKSHKIVRSSAVCFVAGTNLLDSKYRIIRTKQWKINQIDGFKLKMSNNVILMGTGWQNYQSKPNLLSNILYNNTLSKTYYHAVRDEYTKSQLEKIGIKNVYNTGCPTLWGLTKSHCKDIPKTKSKNVIFTITDYRADVDKDKKMIEILQRNYDKVYCWIQGSRDFEYLKSLTDEVIIVNPTLKQFDELLESDEDLDYIGTRLHAGIRAMQKKRRSIIIGVDNRAKEMGKDFNLNVLDRDEINDLESYLNSDIETNINLNYEVINLWKKQFNNI